VKQGTDFGKTWDEIQALIEESKAISEAQKTKEKVGFSCGYYILYLQERTVTALYVDVEK
jgi:hypothetical protein